MSDEHYHLTRKSPLIFHDDLSEAGSTVQQAQDWTQSDHYFTSCWNTSRIMKDDLYFGRMFSVGEEIPSSFGCSSIYLPTLYEFYPYDRKSIYNSELRNIGVEDEILCDRIGDWEKQLNVSCQKILCELDGKSQGGFANLNGMIRNWTDSETNIEDWINYCQYCKVDNLRKYREEIQCNPRDETASYLIRKYPSSAFFCGYHQFGIPFLINTSTITDLMIDLEHTDYSYICYCAESGSFHFKCPSIDTNFELKIEYFALVFNIFNVFSIVATLLLPKGFSMITERRVNWNVLTVILMLASQGSFMGFYMYKMISKEDYIKKIVYLECGFGLATFSLISWLVEFFKFIHYAKTRQMYGKVLVGLRIAIFTGLVLIILLPSLLIGNLVQSKRKKTTFIFLQFYFGSFGIVTLIAFIVGSIFIYRAMKQISDIDIWKTSVSVISYLLVINCYP